jgi:hypothetical protein
MIGWWGVFHCKEIRTQALVWDLSFVVISMKGLVSLIKFDKIKQIVFHNILTLQFDLSDLELKGDNLLYVDQMTRRCVKCNSCKIVLAVLNVKLNLTK